MSLANEHVERPSELREPHEPAQYHLWRDQLRAARERLTHAGEQRLKPIADTDSAAELDVLESSLEELSVAEEELHVQHEQLIDARHMAELEQQRYRSLFLHAPVPYVVTNAEGVIRNANHAAGVLLRRRAEYLEGKPFAVFLPTAERAAFRTRLNGLRAEEPDTVNLTFTLESRGMLSRLVNATVGVVRDRRNKVTELRWLLIDDTERSKREREVVALGAELERRVEERTAQLETLLAENAALLYEAEAARRFAESANREKTELITRVSHELRTPLSAIGGYVELLALGVHGELTPRQAVDVSRVKNAHSHILSLLDDLLSYFRLGTGQLRVDVQRVRVGDTLNEVLSLVAPQADARGIQCVRTPGSEEAIVLADPERLRQVVVNLLANAIKFTPHGGNVELTWRLDGGHVIIDVRDDGIGVPADRIDDIFEPFVQLENGGWRSGLPGGFGLGLPISRGLVQAMSGSLSAMSAPGRGSVFTVRLPRGDLPASM